MYVVVCREEVEVPELKSDIPNFSCFKLVGNSHVRSGLCLKEGFDKPEGTKNIKANR